LLAEFVRFVLCLLGVIFCFFWRISSNYSRKRVCKKCSSFDLIISFDFKLFLRIIIVVVVVVLLCCFDISDMVSAVNTKSINSNIRSRRKEDDVSVTQHQIDTNSKSVISQKSRLLKQNHVHLFQSTSRLIQPTLSLLD